MPNTVKVRIAVAVDPTNGNRVYATAINGAYDDDWALSICRANSEAGELAPAYILTAELEVPEVKEVAAEVERVEPSPFAAPTAAPGGEG